MLKKILFLTIIVTANVAVGQDQFEGIIVYHRTSPDKDNVHGIITAYFSGSKVKVEQEFLHDTAMVKYTHYFDFEQFPMTTFTERNNSIEVDKITPGDHEAQVMVDSQELEYIKGNPCYKIEISYDEELNQKAIKFLSKNHTFKLPKGTLFDGYITSYRHDHIPLKIIEKYQFELGTPVVTIEKNAVLIIPKKLPDSIFEVLNDQQNKN